MKILGGGMKSLEGGMKTLEGGMKTFKGGMKTLEDGGMKTFKGGRNTLVSTIFSALTLIPPEAVIPIWEELKEKSKEINDNFLNEYDQYFEKEWILGCEIND